jgi:L-methionine (R)-S-oxide reductase
MWIMNAKYGADDFYNTLERELCSLTYGEKNLIANLSNISSWLFYSLPDLNWCGFYLWSQEDQELVLGPFQGRPACIRIKPERGVCGKSYSEKRSLRVDDVDQFPGHIACDSSSKSELVIPLMRGGIVWGVLDLDSPKIQRFSSLDEKEISTIMQKLNLNPSNLKF